MKLVLASAVLAASVAAADTSLEEYGSVPPRAAKQIVETECTLDVQLRGAVVTVEQRQRLANPKANGGPYDLAATYNFDLPAGAAVTAFSVGADKAMPIIGEHTTVDVVKRPMLGADPAMLVARPAGAPAQYSIRVQPFAIDSEVTLVTRYTALADIVGGSLRFTLPGRAGHGALSVCRGTVRATSGPGAKIARIVVDNAATTAVPAALILDEKPVMIEAQLAFAGIEPVVWTQTEALGQGVTAQVTTVAAPSQRTQTPLHRRALLVIDTSRSMELVGRANVTKVLRAVSAALPANVEVEAILYDRTAKRVFGAWSKQTADTIAQIEKALGARPATNGSDLTGALALAKTAISDGRPASTIVVVVSDGVLGDTASKDLIAALDAKTSTLDVLAVVLDPARTSSPNAAALRGPVSLYGGSFVEIAANEIDLALPLVDEWLRPSWVDVAGIEAAPATLPSGSGFVRTSLVRGGKPLVLTARGAKAIRVAARPGPAASVGAIVLANTADPDDATAALRPALVARAPFAAPGLAFAVLTGKGNVAKNRAAMVRGGGPYERIVGAADPDEDAVVAGAVKAAALAAPSAIAKLTIERLFRDQLQPKAYACYQRALGTAPTLAGTVQFSLYLGRGEITQVTLAGLGNAQLDACLVDAAYMLNVPMPDFSVNADDQTVANYPLTFAVGKDAPIIVLGDADSASPIDIDAVQGGVPATRKTPVKVETNTPLGTMRPAK